MIKPGEIDRIAIKVGVRATQIQKDYIISWVLWGMTQNEFLRGNLVFKGGTCLKRIYFPTYRFSEDMDFTLLNDKIDDQEIIKNFKTSFLKIFEASRIPLNIQDKSIGTHKVSGSLKFKIEFRGPHGPDAIKVDITRGENVIHDIEFRQVLIGYSDLGEENEFTVKTYSLKEILVEKLVALIGRTIPRDLFDFHYLTEEEKIDLEDIYIEFLIKAEHKGHNPKEFQEKLKSKEAIFARDWEKNLTQQMREGDLPEFKEVWRKSSTHFKKLMGLIDQ